MLTIEVVHPYSCSVEELLPHFHRVEAVQQKYLAVGAQQVQVQINQAAQDNDVAVVSQREVESDIPAALKSLLGSRNTIIQTEQWQREPDGAYQCALNIKLEGVPITIEGTMRLVDDDEGCTNSVTLKLRCALPFIGKKLEKFVAESSDRMMDSEFEYLTDAVSAVVAHED